VSRNTGSNRDALSQLRLYRKLRPGFDAQNGIHFPAEAWGGKRSRNPSNSVVKWLSERRAEDARRKNNIESGVKTTLKVA
jgi:hypothetical protein